MNIEMKIARNLQDSTVYIEWCPVLLFILLSDVIVVTVMKLNQNISNLQCF